MFSELTGTPYPTGTLSQSLVQQMWLTCYGSSREPRGWTGLPTDWWQKEKGKVTQPSGLFCCENKPQAGPDRRLWRKKLTSPQGAMLHHKSACICTRKKVTLAIYHRSTFLCLPALIVTPASPKSQSMPLSGLKSRTPWPESGLQVDKSALLRLILAQSPIEEKHKLPDDTDSIH